MRAAFRFRVALFALLAMLGVRAQEQDVTEDDVSGSKPSGSEDGGAKRANRLAGEKSPYLLQHAYNPVDWYPWGEEAFEKAKREDKPIFLSIGYSTCHWCHVMEHESFENEEVAAYLNEHFVSIKVDREERPDVDRIYMDVCQLVNGSGGWPLSAFLLPDRRPFYAGTYFPTETFLRLLTRVTEFWKDPKRREEAILGPASQITQALKSEARSLEATEGGLAASVADDAFAWYERYHDEAEGGFGQAPKFPRSSNLDFLLRYGARTGKTAAHDIVRNTLDHMLRGGMYDHLGRGFHRYSVDRFWRVPHFEKMLYDNALLARTLVEAWLALGEERYLEVARDTLGYILDDLTHPEGPFYSAEDADTEGREGLTYIWKRPEILEILGEERGAVFADYYGATVSGNFVDPHFADDRGQCVLHETLEGREAALAEKLGRPLAEVSAQLAEDRAKLLAVRERRPQPFLDDKVLVEWNGLAISALARAHQATGDARYLEAAQRAAGFILDRMVKDGRLQRRFRAGEVSIDAFLEDHAFLTEALIDLWEASFEPRWLEAAVHWGRETLRLFQAEDGTFWATADHHEELIRRSKEFYDGAVPSGNSVAYGNFLRLAEITTDKAFTEAAKRFEAAAATYAAKTPSAHPQLLCGLEFRLAKPYEFVVVGPRDDEMTQAMLREIRGRFLPAKVVLWAANAEAANELAKIAPLCESKLAIDGKATAYVCREQVCQLPSRDVAGLRGEIE